MSKLKIFLKKILLLLMFGAVLCIPYKIIGSINDAFLMMIAVLHLILLFILCFPKKTQKSFLYLIVSFLACISFYVYYRNLYTYYPPAESTCKPWCWLRGNYEKDLKVLMDNKEPDIREKLCKSLCEKDKHLTGAVRIYHRNGKLSREENYVDGKEEGISKIYDTHGTLNMEIQYSDGKKNGYERQYRKNGKLDYEAIYKNGEFIRKIWYDEEGNPK